jgi:hypothetical protein
MMAIDSNFKNTTREALLDNQKNFEGSDQQFAKKWSINGAVWSRIKKGQIDGVLADRHWINIARELGVGVHQRQWQPARTAVFTQIESEINFCQENSKSMIYVDDCEIGKTFTAKYLSRSLRNCFYVDASQAKTKCEFVRKLARAVGIDPSGKYAELKDDVKYYLKFITKPIVIVDEAGDLEYSAFLELKEFWNATEGVCGWYMIGADGLRAKIEKGIRNQKVGYRELFSRFSGNFRSTVPVGRQEKLAFYQTLIRTVLEANMTDKSSLNEIVKRCITKDTQDNIGGLRRAESLLMLHQQSEKQNQ